MNKYITRLAEIRLKQCLETRKIILLLGARQVGKTTLFKRILDPNSTLFLNLDVNLDRQRLLAASTLAPTEALTSLGKPQILVIDEAQKLPEATRIVKGWFDAELPLKIVLSGSSSLDLLDQSAESLTGRNIKVFLPPLIFSEILMNQSWYSPVFGLKQLSQFKTQIDSLVLSNLVYGSFPESVTSADKTQYLSNLVSDYLLKDIFHSGLIKIPNLLQKLLALLAHQSGSLVSVNELANNLNLSRKTVDRYLDLLERTFIIFKLSAFSTNPRKEIAKRQKIFFWDTGVRNALIGELNFNPLRSDIGQLWENWVIAEVAKKNFLEGNLNKLYFWRSRQGSEVDLVIKKPVGSLSAYEIKWSSTKTTTRKFTNRYQIPVEIINKDNFITYL